MSNMKVSKHTQELYRDLAVNKLISTKNFTETTPFVNIVLRGTAKGKAEVVVCFLWIVIWPNFVHPQGNLLISLILEQKKKESKSMFKLVSLFKFQNDNLIITERFYVSNQRESQSNFDS